MLSIVVFDAFWSVDVPQLFGTTLALLSQRLTCGHFFVRFCGFVRPVIVVCRGWDDVITPAIVAGRTLCDGLGVDGICATATFDTGLGADVFCLAADTVVGSSNLEADGTANNALARCGESVNRRLLFCLAGWWSSGAHDGCVRASPAVDSDCGEHETLGVTSRRDFSCDVCNMFVAALARSTTSFCCAG